ncbi:hypothetical protein B0H14DRAFT_3616682 [Mycena olivaceomarginata]|nr:hypothetical protein B0H14DRAFT_3616682 [Mycena olivaceomarginata]
MWVARRVENAVERKVKMMQARGGGSANGGMERWSGEEGDDTGCGSEEPSGVDPIDQGSAVVDPSAGLQAEIGERCAATTARWGGNGQSGVGCNPEARLQGADVEGTCICKSRTLSGINVGNCSPSSSLTTGDQRLSALTASARPREAPPKDGSKVKLIQVKLFEAKFWGDDSDDEDETGDTVAPMFSCHHRGSHIRLHTHARADHLVFNLGPHIFELVLGEAQHRTLKSHAASCWSALTKKGPLSTELKLTIKLGKPKEKK